ncbi:MAG TPA: type II and III secretion system protein family protein [Caulobacteraceae bacterium]|jgi:pilus assembly protein CpaC|nr:type II and III secretion system protein family protein [Caulobacteraceae bacterium]
MSLRRTAAQTLSLLAALAFAGQDVLAQTAFPKSSLQPSAYTGRPAIGAATLPPAAIAPSRNAASTMRIDLGGPEAPTRMMSLPKGKSAVIELPVDARDVLVSDPKVADVVLSTPRRIYVLGVGAGQTDAVFFDGAGRQLLNLNIRVDQDISALAETLKRLMPDDDIRVEGVNGSLVLSGTVTNLGEADKALQIARSTVSDPKLVINMLGIAESEQVMLKVRIVEVNRTVIKQLGVNLNAVVNQIGQPQYVFGTASTFGVNGALLGGLSGGYKYDSTQVPTLQIPCGDPTLTGCKGVVRSIQDAANYNTATATTVVGKPGLNQGAATLQAFERVGLVRTLAEPNLTATSGEAAKFLAGGEFPVPAGRDNNGQVTVEFKPYGVGLGFTPVVLSKGRISLKVSTEYSEITNVGSVTIGSGTVGGATVNVPGLTVRRAETMVELPSGGSMMIAGLLQSTTKSTIDSLPGLTQLPILGALFRSRDFLNDETELVVIVTPYLVKSVSPDQLQTPADGLQIADDLQTTLLGRLNTAFGRYPAKTADATYRGPYGYVVD